MSLIFTDGFDYLGGSDVYRKYNSVGGAITASASFSRNRLGKGLRIQNDSSTLKYVCSTGAKDYTLTLGVAMKFGFTASQQDTLYFGDAVGGDQLAAFFYPANSSQLTLFRGGTTLATLAGSYNPYAFNYYEFKVFKNSTSGFFLVRINGSPIISLTGINTQNNGTNPFDYFRFVHNNAGNPWTDYDDLYLCNSSGAINNDFLGNVQITTLYPNNSGDSTQWTPSGVATNYLNINEQTFISTTGFNLASGTGIEDLYHFDNFSIPIANVKAVVLNMMLNKSGTTSLTINPELKINGNIYTGTNILVAPSTILNYNNIWEINPETSGNWVQSDIENLQAGLKTV